MNISRQSGQVMLLIVFIVGAGILSMTAISGYLLTQRIRMSSNLVDSTRAIYAADAGLECERYNQKTPPPASPINCNLFSDSAFVVSNTDFTTIIDVGARTIKSLGVSNNAYRAFSYSY